LFGGYDSELNTQTSLAYWNSWSHEENRKKKKMVSAMKKKKEGSYIETG
jgi:hypothetical protein